MKTTIMKSLLVITVVSLSIVLYSCKGKKEVSPSKGAVELTIPCSDEGRSDKDFFRADNSATSQNMSLSREKALVMAKQRMAGLIEAQIKSVTDRYVNEYEVGDAMDFSGKFENLTREVVNRELTDVTIICEKNFQEEGGRYTTYIAIEVNKDALFNGLNNSIGRDAKLNVDYDKMQYEKIFNEEMKKLEEQRP